MLMMSTRARLAALVLGGMPLFACGGGGGGDGDGTDGTDTTGSTTSAEVTTLATMTTTGTSTTTGVTVTASTTVGPSDTGTVPEPCCAPSGVPGCAEDPDIAACVCEVDRYCCESVWDEVCAEKVVALGCGICDPGPSTMTTTASSTSPTTSDVTTGQPPDNVGPCCSPHPETGCELEGLSDCVCAAEPSCCTDEWHDGCVDAVDANGCGVCPPDPTTTTVSTTDPDTGVPPDNTEGCCETHDSTGCVLPAIADCVCAENPACCDIAWDEECVDAVDALGCGVCPP